MLIDGGEDGDWWVWQRDFVVGDWLYRGEDLFGLEIDKRKWGFANFFYL